MDSIVDRPNSAGGMIMILCGAVVLPQEGMLASSSRFRFARLSRWGLVRNVAQNDCCELSTLPRLPRAIQDKDNVHARGDHLQLGSFPNHSRIPADSRVDPRQTIEALAQRSPHVTAGADWL